MKQAYEYLVSLATITLVMAGIGGVSFNTFRDRGWLESLLGRLWSFELDYPMIAIPVTVGGVLLLRAWRNHQVIHGRISRLPAFLIYCLMGAGAYFIGYYALHGGL